MPRNDRQDCYDTVGLTPMNAKRIEPTAANELAAQVSDETAALNALRIQIAQTVYKPGVGLAREQKLLSSSDGAGERR